MTHTSWINERGDQGRDNERLEYLGDAVLELVAGEYLFNRFPTYDEGQLTQMRSSLVSTVALARLGEQLLLGETLRLGRGAAKSGARRLTSLHANAFEALIGAIFLDQGYRKAGRVFLSRIGDLSAWTDPNFKGRLQALAQERFGAPPQYRTVPLGGDLRTRQYLSQVSVEGQATLGEGRGGTKQAAEQGAARAAIDVLVAPVSKKRRRRSRAPVDAAAGATPEFNAPSPGGLEPVPLEVAAPSGRHRRPRNAAGLTAPVPSPSDVVPAEPITPVEAPPPSPRRRGRRGSTTGAAPAVTAGEPDPAGTTPPAAAPTDVPTPRRRRRRSAAGNQAPVGSADPGEPIGAPSPAAEPTVAPGPGSRRRRRRGPAAIAETDRTGSQDLAAGPTTPVAAVPEPSDSSDQGDLTAAPAEPAKRRTHRGHRGGRRRSGRAATPEP